LEKDGQATVQELEPVIRNAVSAALREDGWATLSLVGSMIAKNNPAFDPRNYGCSKLGDLVRKLPYLEVSETRGGGTSASTQLLVRFSI